MLIPSSGNMSALDDCIGVGSWVYSSDCYCNRKYTYLGKSKLQFDLNRDLTTPGIWFDQAKIWSEQSRFVIRFDSRKFTICFKWKDLDVNSCIRNNATNVSTFSRIGTKTAIKITMIQYSGSQSVNMLYIKTDWHTVSSVTRNSGATGQISKSSPASHFLPSVPHLLPPSSYPPSPYVLPFPLLPFPTISNPFLRLPSFPSPF